ncbi:MAG TPA: tetratricopeptide repeat protein, partial [Rhodothermia bacterium]
RTVFLLLILLISLPAVSQNPEDVAAGWKADLVQVRTEIKTTHPNPFANISEEAWEAAFADVESRLGRMTRNEFGVALQKLVALLGDAHTSVNPQLDRAVSGRRYPIELYLFEDGLHVIAAAPEYSALVGGRVVQIGKADPGRAISSVAETISHENAWWIRAMAPERLVIPEVLDGLGITGDADSLAVTVEKDGVRHSAVVDPVTILQVEYHGHGTPLDKSDWIDMTESAEKPLSLEHPNDPMWHAWLEDSSTLYVCYRAVISPDSGPSNHEFWEEVFGEADRRSPKRLVIDIRENSGGNGMLNRNVIQQIVRRPDLDRPDRLFVIIGRRTFSAGQQLANQLDWWTQATFAGEPTGQRVSQYGDALRVELVHSGISVFISTRFHQGPNPLDTRDFVPPDVYAPVISEDYRKGADAAFIAILSNEERESVMSRVVGALQAGQFDVAERHLGNANLDPANRYRDFEADVNAIGYDLLGRGQVDAAIAVFEINTRVYPGSANAFDSLGEALVTAGRHQEAIEAYRQAVNIDPGLPSSLRALRKLESRGGH